MPKATYHHGDLKSAILDAAEDVLCDRSLDAISMRELARTAGVSPGAPYHHFGDRAGLVVALCQRGFLRLEALLSAANEKNGLLGMVRAYLEFAQTHSALYQLMFSAEATEGERKTLLHPFAAPVFELLAQDIEQKSSGSAPRGSNIAAVSVWCFMHGAASLSIGPALEGRLQDTRLDHFAFDTLKILTGITE